MAAFIHSVKNLYITAVTPPPKTLDYDALKLTSENAKLARIASETFKVLAICSLCSTVIVATTFSVVFPPSVCLAITCLACFILFGVFKSKSNSLYKALKTDKYEELFLSRLNVVIDSVTSSHKSESKANKIITEFNKVLNIDNLPRLIRLDNEDPKSRFPVLKIYRPFSKDKGAVDAKNDNTKELNILTYANAKMLPIKFSYREPDHAKDFLFIYQYLEKILAKWCDTGDLEQLTSRQLELIKVQLKFLSIPEICTMSMETPKKLIFSTQFIKNRDLLKSLIQTLSEKYKNLQFILLIPPHGEEVATEFYKTFALESNGIVQVQSL